jgi:hypothetical protein
MKKFNNDKELLSAYLDGELSQEEKKYIEEKIKYSLELQKELSDLKKLKDVTSTSIDRISDSPYFETRVMTALSQSSTSKAKFKKWIPAISLTVLTLGLMVLLKLNPNLINDVIEKQKSNITGFYKENLRPLLYAANLTNEDIFNFAVYQQLPLDSTKNQVLKLGSDPQGSDYFEIKKVENASVIRPADNLQKFVSALKLNKEESDQIDSIISSYADQLSSSVLVNEQNSVAINPTIWNTRKAILADILSFAKKHASNDLEKLIPHQMAEIDEGSFAKLVSTSKKAKDNQYIFCTPDSIFKEDFVFDISQFKKNIEKMEKEFKRFNIESKKLDKESKNIKNFTFYFDTTKIVRNNKEKFSRQFKVFVDSDFVKVTVPNINIPDFNFEENLKIPDLDSLAVIISNATKNIRIIIPPIPPLPNGEKSFQIDGNSGRFKKQKRLEINLDSLMNLQNSIQDSVRSKQNKEFEKFNDSLMKNFNLYLNDSLIYHQNKELKKEMDKLREELQKFREEMKKFDNQLENNDKNNFQETSLKKLRIKEI